MWWNANEALKNFVQAAFLGVPKAVNLNIIDRWCFGKVRSTDAGILHLAPWCVSSLFSQGRVHKSQPLCRCLRDSSPLSSVNLFSRNPAAHLSLHNCTLKLFATSMWQEAYQNRSQSEGLSKQESFPHGPLEINRYQALNKKQSFFSERTWGDTSVVFFCWSNPLFQTNRESGISKERLSYFNPLSWPIATALLQDSYKSLGNMNVMERSYELWEVGGGKGMHSSLKFCQMRPHSKSVLWNKERIAYDNAMAWTWVGLTFYSVVSQSSPHWIPSPQNNDQMWLLLLCNIGTSVSLCWIRHDSYTYLTWIITSVLHKDVLWHCHGFVVMVIPY